MHKYELLHSIWVVFQWLYYDWIINHHFFAVCNSSRLGIVNVAVNITRVQSLLNTDEQHETQNSNIMAKVIAITGTTKVVVSKDMSHNAAQTLRRNLMQADEHFDMLGNPTCKFRLKN